MGARNGQWYDGSYISYLKYLIVFSFTSDFFSHVLFVGVTLLYILRLVVEINIDVNCASKTNGISCYLMMKGLVLVYQPLL